MSLKTIRFLRRVIGAILILYGIYLIVITQLFFGTLAIIIAFLIFPTLGEKTAKQNQSPTTDYKSDHDIESSSEFTSESD